MAVDSLSRTKWPGPDWLSESDCHSLHHNRSSSPMFASVFHRSVDIHVSCVRPHRIRRWASWMHPLTLIGRCSAINSHPVCSRNTASRCAFATESIDMLRCSYSPSLSRWILHRNEFSGWSQRDQPHYGTQFRPRGHFWSTQRLWSPMSATKRLIHYSIP